MAVTPSNILSLPLKHLQDAIAASASFQSWAGTTPGAATLARIHLVGVDVATIVRPFALIDFGEKYESDHISSQGQFLQSGELLLLFEDNVAVANAGNHGDAKIAFTNPVGAVLSDVQALAGIGPYLSVQKVRLKSGPTRSSESERAAGTDLYQAVFEVLWGA